MTFLKNLGWSDKRLVVPLGVAVTFLGVSLGVEFLPQFLAPSAPPEAGAVWPASPPSSVPVALPAAPTVRPAAPSTTGAPLTMDEFMDLLARETPARVSRKVTAAFLRDPALRKTWTEFRATHDGRAPARDLLRRLASLPEFRRLTSQFRDDPGFQRAFLRLAAIPAVSAAIREATGAGQEANGPRTIYRPTGGARNPASGPPGGSAAGPTAQSFLGGSTPAGSIAGASSSSRFDSSAPTGTDPDRGDDAHKVGKDLARVQDARKSADAQAYLDSLFASIPKEARDKLMAVCLTQGICDPIDACVAAGVAQECAAACAKTGRCSFDGSQTSAAAAICAPVCGDRMDESCRECRRNPDAYAAAACAPFCADPLDESCRACRRNPSAYGR